MDKPILKDSMKLFEPLGNIRSRSMFGGFGLFANDIMFALVVKNTLHIRADKNSLEQFTQQGLAPYSYQKRGFPVITKYFALPADAWDNPDKILTLAQRAFLSAKQDKINKSTVKITRLKDLPNMRLATERMLKKAGITSVEELQKTGAADAFKAIQQNLDVPQTMTNFELLWALEGAIEGKHWSVITPQRRDELISILN